MLWNRPESLSPPVGLEIAKARGASYGEHLRTDLLDKVGNAAGRVLDVGCAEGRAADALRERGATLLCGVEIEERYARVAERRYDEVLVGSIEGELPWENASFDTILCYDVLEHLYDPWAVVRRLRALLSSAGTLHVSLPNSRNFEFWRSLVFKGTFGYAPSGLRDVTHLRYFTRTDATVMLEVGGFHVVSTVPRYGLSRKRQALLTASRGRAMEFLAYQWTFLAQPRFDCDGQPDPAGGR